MVGETNILQQILRKSVARFRRYSTFYISQSLTMEAAIFLTLLHDQNRKIFIYRIWFIFLHLRTVLVD